MWLQYVLVSIDSDISLMISSVRKLIPYHDTIDFILLLVFGEVRHQQSATLWTFEAQWKCDISHSIHMYLDFVHEATSRYHKISIFCPTPEHVQSLIISGITRDTMELWYFLSHINLFFADIIIPNITIQWLLLSLFLFWVTYAVINQPQYWHSVCVY